MKNKKKLFILGLVYLLTAGTGIALEKVTLQLRWDHQFQFAGYYAAQWKGYYKDAGLNVDIRSALESNIKILSSVDEVAERRADFGIGAIDVLLAKNNGIPLVILATIFQKSAAGFFFKENTKLTSLADLTTLRVARRVNSLIDLEFQAMLKSEGIDPNLIKPYPHQGGIDHLLNDQIDVMPGYTTASPFAFRNDNIKFKTLSPWRYGIDFYGDSLFTHNDLIEKNPQTVTAFKNASIKGWYYALNYPDEVVKKIASDLPRKAIQLNLLEFNQFQVNGVKDLTLYPLVEIGHTNPYRWKRMHDHLSQLGIVNGTLDTNEFIYDPERRKQEAAEKFRKRINYAVFGFICFVALVLSWVFILRRTVTKRTMELSEEVTIRKQTEDQLRQSEIELLKAQQVSHVGSWVWNIQNDHLEWSDEMYQIFDVDKEMFNGKLGEVISQRIHPDDKAEVDRLNLAVIEDSNPIPTEYRIIWRDGTIRDVWAEAGELMLDKSGKPASLTGIVQDITDRKQSENQIKMALKEKETLLHEIHHRVKNNMQVISSLLDLQSDTIRDEKIKNALRECRSRVHTMAAVHESLHESDKLSEIDVQTYLYNITSSIFDTYAIEPGKITLVNNVEAFPISAKQASPLGLVINELISNALKYAFPDDRKGKVTISMEQTSDKLRLTVMDDGVGFPKGFDWRDSKSLGLKLVKILAEDQLNGSVEMESNGGTRFTINFKIGA